MSHSFLIDECLSPSLAVIARDHRYHLSTCVRDMGMQGKLDHEVARFAIKENHILVTHNAVDFRGPQGEQGGLYSQAEIHPGLICLVSSAGSIAKPRQIELFERALTYVAAMDDLINKVVEVVEDEYGEIFIDIYDLPS